MSAAGRSLTTVAIFATMALAFTWPLALDPGGWIVCRHFDAYGALWLLGASDSVGADLITPQAAWPVGKSLELVDSWLLLAGGRLLTPWLTPVWIANLWTLGGLVLSAWAAERFAAHCLGARWPWSIVAGAAYGFSGSAATALLEGSFYHLLLPWLPLAGWSMAVALGPRGRWHHGLAAGLFWCLCLLTSAYQGLSASLLLVVMIAFHLGALRSRWPGLLAALGIILPAGLSYGMLVTRSAARTFPDTAAFSASQLLSGGSVGLGDLAAWTPATDLRHHSTAPLLGFGVLVLALVAPLVIRRRRLLWACLTIAAIAVAVSLGPELRLLKGEPGLPWVLDPLGRSSWGHWFRFPVRLLWAGHLALGAAAAAALTQLARHRAAWAAPLLGFVVLEALIGNATPARLDPVPVAAPSAYAAAGEGAVFDLYADFQGYAADVGHFINDTGCAYQWAHGKPVLNACLQPLVPQGPQVAVGNWLRAELMATRTAPSVAGRLGALGIGTVVLHPDTFPPDSREVIRDTLRELLGPPIAESRDGGEYVLAYRVEPDLSAPGDAYRALLEEGWR